MKHEGFLFIGIFFFLNKKFPPFSMLYSSRLIVKKGERRRENGDSGFFWFKEAMRNGGFILHSPCSILHA